MVPWDRLVGSSSPTFVFLLEFYFFGSLPIASFASKNYILHLVFFAGFWSSNGSVLPFFRWFSGALLIHALRLGAYGSLCSDLSQLFCHHAATELRCEGNALVGRVELHFDRWIDHGSLWLFEDENSEKLSFTGEKAGGKLTLFFPCRQNTYSSFWLILEGKIRQGDSMITNKDCPNVKGTNWADLRWCWTSAAGSWDVWSSTNLREKTSSGGVPWREGAKNPGWLGREIKI